MDSSRECGSDLRSKRGGQSNCWKKQRKRCSRRQVAGKMSHHSMRNLSDKRLRLEERTTGRTWCRREVERVLQRGGARRRGAEERGAADSAGEHRLPEADHRASRRTGWVTLSHLCPFCHRCPFENYIWWVSSKHGKKQCNWWRAAHGGQCDWRNPDRVLIMQDST